MTSGKHRRTGSKDNQAALFHSASSGAAIDPAALTYFAVAVVVFFFVSISSAYILVVLSLPFSFSLFISLFLPLSPLSSSFPLCLICHYLLTYSHLAHHVSHPLLTPSSPLPLFLSLLHPTRATPETPADLFPGAGDAESEAACLASLTQLEHVVDASTSTVTLQGEPIARVQLDGTACWLRRFPSVSLRRTAPSESGYPAWAVDSLLRDLRALYVPPNNALCPVETVLAGLNSRRELALAVAYRCEGTSETFDVLLRTWRHARKRGTAAPREVNALKHMSERVRICAAIAIGVGHLHHAKILHGNLCTRAIRIGSDGKQQRSAGWSRFIQSSHSFLFATGSLA